MQTTLTRRPAAPLSASQQAAINAALAILQQRWYQPMALRMRTEELRQFLQLQLLGQRQRMLYAAYLGRQGELRWCGRLFCGDDRECVVYPREVAVEAMAHGAYGALVAFNACSDAPGAREAASNAAQLLAAALQLVGVRLLDYLLIRHGAIESLL